MFIYINSTGCTRADGETVGFETEGMAIFDTMSYVKNEINTVGVGVAIGQACMLLSAGTKGKRFMLPHATAMLHQPRVPPTGARQVSARPALQGRTVSPSDSAALAVTLLPRPCEPLSLIRRTLSTLHRSFSARPSLRSSLVTTLSSVDAWLQATEVEIKWREVLAEKQDFLSIMSRTTGQPTEKLDRDMQRPLYMQPLDALEYGIIDGIVKSQSEKNLIDSVRTGADYDRDAGLRVVQQPQQ